MAGTTLAPSKSFTAFIGDRRIASGDLVEVAVAAMKLFDPSGPDALLVFDDSTSELVEVDLRGSARDVAARMERVCQANGARPVERTPPGPGRPKLGVVGREVTLLPRHWDWLDAQPGGASVTLRKLVESAKRANVGQEAFRKAQEATYRFMTAMAGDLPGFEEAMRLLFSANRDRSKLFEAQVRKWPADIKVHVLRLFRRTLELEQVETTE